MSLDFGFKSFDNSVPDLHSLLNANMLAIDAETTGLSVASDRLLGYSLATNTDQAYFVLPDNRFFADLLANDKVTKIGHNIKFDRAIFKKHNIPFNNVWDTMIAAHLMEETRQSLDFLLHQHFYHKINHKTYLDFGKKIEYSSLDQLVNHFSSHAIGVIYLYHMYSQQLKENGLERPFYEVEMPLVPVLSDMEATGVHIDTDALMKFGDKLNRMIELSEASLCYQIGAPPDMINFNSPDQVALYIYDWFSVPKPPTWTYRDKPRPSVDKTHLEKFNKMPFVGTYLNYKHYKHLYNTYVTGIMSRLVDGRIHTNFNQTRTRTGRLSSTDPNLQNIPIRSDLGRAIREAFIATPGTDSVIIKADYDQMELRDVACQAGCIPLIEAFLSGEDVHAKTAIRIFKDIKRRPEAKTLHYQLVYGGGEEEHVKMFYESYPEIKKWIESVHHFIHTHGYVRTRYGRRRSFGRLDAMSLALQHHSEREAVSTKVQGSCAEVMKISMRKIWNEVKSSPIKMLLQIHDELVFECPKKYVADLYDILERNMVYKELQVPLTSGFKVGKSWASGTSINNTNIKDINTILASF